MKFSDFVVQKDATSMFESKKKMSSGTVSGSSAGGTTTGSVASYPMVWGNPCSCGKKGKCKCATNESSGSEDTEDEYVPYSMNPDSKVDIIDKQTTKRPNRDSLEDESYRSPAVRRALGRHYSELMVDVNRQLTKFSQDLDNVIIPSFKSQEPPVGKSERASYDIFVKNFEDIKSSNPSLLDEDAINAARKLILRKAKESLVDPDVLAGLMHDKEIELKMQEKHKQQELEMAHGTRTSPWD